MRVKPSGTNSFPAGWLARFHPPARTTMPSSAQTTAPRRKAASTRAKSADAIQLLKDDHRKAEETFEQFEKARGEARKKQLADKVCMMLKVHTRIEEEIFYPACRGEVDDELLDEADVEHNSAKALIAEIEAGSPADELYDARVKVLSEYIRHHVKEEEQRGGLFAQARKAGLDLQALGARLAERKAELEKQMKAAQPH